MKLKTGNRRIAILGGGPSGLFIYKRLIESNRGDFTVDIFEAGNVLGAGMPYSDKGANVEHVTNVSDNEIPDIVTSIEEWIQTVPPDTLAKFNLDPKRFNEYKVLPRLLFGQYLSAQFDLLKQMADDAGIETTIHLDSKITDIIDQPEDEEVWIQVGEKDISKFDCVIICTGHKWPIKHEGKIPGYFDSPYPPVKLAFKADHTIAIRGSSLTAIDAIRTLARCNGTFTKSEEGILRFNPAEGSSNFKLVMHSRNGMLPAVRFHLEDPLLSKDSLLSKEEITQNIAENNGFLSLDYVFQKDFKDTFKGKDSIFYDFIKDRTIEEFVEAMMNLREKMEPFELFRVEYLEAEKSIKRKESIYWKEMLAVLSFAMNYPAKYLSAEDMIRLQKVLMPLISIVIAFVPQSSCEELLALHDAGKLDIVSVGSDNSVEPAEEGGATFQYTDENGESKSDFFKTFIDCVGQPHLSYDAFPFNSLVSKQSVTPARLKFKSPEEGKAALKDGNKEVESDENGEYYLKVPGIVINDNFQIVDKNGENNDRVYIMAVPYIGGFNPDYSGLDFCEEASDNIVKNILDLQQEPIY